MDSIRRLDHPIDKRSLLLFAIIKISIEKSKGWFGVHGNYALNNIVLYSAFEISLTKFVAIWSGHDRQYDNTWGGGGGCVYAQNE